MNTQLVFTGSLSTSDPHVNPVLIVGQTKHLSQLSYDAIRVKLEPHVSAETYASALNNLHPSPTDTCPLWLTNATIAALPSKCSRHNTPSRAHSLTKIVRTGLTGTDDFIVVACERSDVFASAAAVARALPMYSRKSSNAASKSRIVTVEFVLVGTDADKELTDTDIACLQALSYGVRLAARIVDTPCSEMYTDVFLEEAKAVGDELTITPTVVSGEDLNTQGFGGLYGVGKGADHPPALCVLSHTPEGATRTIAWVGKGIVYDTGGLCIKAKTSMIGMKRDCGGAAGMLGAFYAAVKLGFKDNLHLVLCLAENAVGPSAQRPDDIIKLYSGRTVEINNTDAEGRLVLGDGVAYAHKDLNADIIVDMATLTGAQGVATGRYHAGIVTNNEDWETATVKAGKCSGDLVHPLPYSPELHFNEFASSLADMKNSVADRSNAQVSCAAMFIGSHIGFDYSGVWLHVDIASPAHMGERATGYGVALLMTLFGQSSDNSLLQYITDTKKTPADDDETAMKKVRLE